MDLFEFQGKQYFATFGIPVSPGGVAATVDESVAAAEKAGYPVVVKAQVQVGGRGKAGGIQLAKDADEVRTHAGAILGMDIKGHIVKRVWVEHASDIAKEYYASFTLDRSAKLHLGMLSARGGVDIEQVAEEEPDAIARIHVDPVDGLDEARARAWVTDAKLDAEAIDGAVDILVKLYRCYVDGDADLVEINPLILTPDGKVHALDAKVTLDDNASFRHPEWDEFRGLSEIDPREALAKEHGLQYVGLDGDVGVIANGAGLAMSTCDVVNQVGGKPANFLDIGGGASAQVMANALEVINKDPNVKSIFINIFGGITKGEDVANGIVQAMGQVKLNSPIVIRLDGTNAEQGREILKSHESDRLISVPTMVGAAQKAVELAGSARVSIFVNKDTLVIWQGITGGQGSYYSVRNREYGTQVVGGVNPKKAGTDVQGIPVFATVAEAKAATGATVSVVIIPAAGAAGAVMEAAEADMELVVCLTEGIPAQDEAGFFNTVRRFHPGTRILGPNCPGLVTVGECNIGFIPADVAKPGGPVGIVSRSGTLTYQALKELGDMNIGVTTCVGIGGDPVPGTSFIDCLAAFEADPDTKAVMLFGEIGGSAEEEAAAFIADKMTKPVSAYVAGVTAPPGKKMGHAGAIISGSKGTASAKMEALAAAGVKVGRNPTECGELMAEIVKGL